MGFILLAAMIGVPILEIAVFIQAGELIGLWPTIGAVIVTAIVGTTLLRIQGLATLFRAQRNLEEGRLPIVEVFDGLCLLLAGALLLTPGFVTDGVGLLLFAPPFRSVLRAWASRFLVHSGRVQTWSTGPASPPPPTDGDRGTVIDGEYEDVSERDNNGPGSNDGNDNGGSVPPTRRVR